MEKDEKEFEGFSIGGSMSHPDENMSKPLKKETADILLKEARDYIEGCALNPGDPKQAVLLAGRISDYFKASEPLQEEHVRFLRDCCIISFERDTGVKYTEASPDVLLGVEKTITMVTEIMTPIMRLFDPKTNSAPMNSIHTVIMAGTIATQLIGQTLAQAMPQMDAVVDKFMAGSEIKH